MGLIFIPSDDYSSDATAATPIAEDIYLGIVQQDRNLSYSFRIGNAGSSAETFTFEVSDEFDPQVEDHIRLLLGGAYIDLAAPISLAAGECTDTIGLFITRDDDILESRYYLPILSTVTSGGDRTSLEMAYEAVGPHSYKDRQYPERATEFTDAISGAIDKFSEPLVLHRYDPITYNPEDERVFVSFDNITGKRRFSTQSDCCERLKPDNATWGYDHAQDIIYASFQNEEYDIRLNFTQTNTEMTFNGTARLYIPAEYDLLPIWGLFNLETETDAAQFKRTVWLTQRRGVIYYLANLMPKYRGSELAYHRADLIALHDAAMGSPDFFNPFALSYEWQSDKPYAMYPCRLGMFITSFLAGDSSGSLAGS